MAKAKTDMLLDFVYDGVNRRGQKVKGETTSRSLELAKATLRKQGISVKGIKKKPKPLYTFKKSIKPIDIAIFSRQMATMMKAGVPLTNPLRLLLTHLTIPV